MNRPTPVHQRPQAPPPIPQVHDDPNPQLARYKKTRRRSKAPIALAVLIVGCFGCLVGGAVLLSSVGIPGVTGDMWAVEGWFAEQANPEYEVVKRYPTMQLSHGRAVRLKFRKDTILGPGVYDRVFFVANGAVMGWYDDHPTDAPLTQEQLDRACTQLHQLANGANVVKMTGGHWDEAALRWWFNHARGGRGYEKIDPANLQTVKQRNEYAERIRDLERFGYTITLVKGS